MSKKQLAVNAAEYMALTTQIQELEASRKLLATELKGALGYESLDLSNGLTVTKYQMERKSYPVKVVRELFGRSADSYLKVDKTKLDETIKGGLKMTANGSMEHAGWARMLSRLTAEVVVEGSADALRVTETK